MSKWHSLDLGDGTEASKPTEKIQEAFWPIYQANCSPEDMGVYSRYDLEKNMVTVYFTPSASQLAEIFKAKECEEPLNIRLSFVVGPASCLNSWPVGRRG